MEYEHLYKRIQIDDKHYQYYDISALEDSRYDKLPICIRYLLEAAIRNYDGFLVSKKNVEEILDWNNSQKNAVEIPFIPARVLLQDFTGVPAIVDLASMRDAVQKLGFDPEKINPICPVDLVIDHSVQWGADAFKNLSIIPPGSGIVHQVNLEYLAKTVAVNEAKCLYPDSVVGTDSHTTMINGSGILAWGVGGIEAEAVMLGQPICMVLPEVIGYCIYGKLPEQCTSTDLVLTVTNKLRSHGVVGKFIEFFGPGVSNLSIADRATIANMCPEYGATVAFFPVDKRTLSYLQQTGRDKHAIKRTEAYLKQNKMFVDSDFRAQYTIILELDLATIVPCVSGPKRPHDTVPIARLHNDFKNGLREKISFKGFGIKPESVDTLVDVDLGDQKITLKHGSVVISAITSCTNTSNPSVMLGRVHAHVRANYLASPPLVVVYGLAGRVDLNIENESIGKGNDGKDVYLKDIWPTRDEVAKLEETYVLPQFFKEVYANVKLGNNQWQNLECPAKKLYSWNSQSMYIKKVPFFENMTMDLPVRDKIINAYALLSLGDSVTTDHISPAGSISRTSPAARFLIEHDVSPVDFNTYGARRGNDEVMVRGTFANIRLINKLASKIGPKTLHIPSGDELDVYDVAERYLREGHQVIILAGKEYGCGSSRDWAAKGPYLLGVKAVLAESYERIHRSNLIGMGIIPLQYRDGENAEIIGLSGKEKFTIEMPCDLEPGANIVIKTDDGKCFDVLCRFDTAVEITYFKNGGILPYVIRKLVNVHK